MVCQGYVTGGWLHKNVSGRGSACRQDQASDITMMLACRGYGDCVHACNVVNITSINILILGNLHVINEYRDQ